jgi:hypothetical protein
MADTVLTATPGTAPVPAPDPAEPAAPAATVTYGDWRDVLAEDIRGEKSLGNIKGTTWDEAGPALAKSYVHAQRAMGSRVAIPGKDAKPEDVAAFKSRLTEAGIIDAVPEAPDKYTAKMHAPEGAAVDEEALAGFHKTAHALGLTDKQAQGVLDIYVEQTAKMGGAVEVQRAAQFKETTEALAKEWGAAAGRETALANRAALDLGGQEFVDRLVASGMANDLLMVKVLNKAGHLLAEDDAIFRDTVGSSDADAKAKLQAIMTDPKHPYYGDNSTPGHKEAVAEVKKLHEVIERLSAG